MNGLLRRLTRRRAAPADETPPGTPAASSEPADATVTSIEEERPLSEEEKELLAREEELRRRRRDLPAGVDPDELEAPAGEGARRGALRRRIRYLSRVRELLLRDLGGFYFEVHRAGTTHGGHRDILENKAARLDAIDRELRELEARLGEEHSGRTVLREPGIGGTCPTCGELHASDAGWCAHCGTPLSERARRKAEQEVDRAVAARREKEPAKQTGAHEDLVARVRQATASDERTETGEISASGRGPGGHDTGGGDVGRREASGHDTGREAGGHDTGGREETDPPTNGTNPEGNPPTGERREGDDDPVTHGERRR